MMRFPLASLRIYTPWILKSGFENRRVLAPWLHRSTGLISLMVIGFLTLAGIIFQACLHRYFYVQSDLKQVKSEIEILQQQKKRLDQFEKTKKENPQAFKDFQKKRFGDKLTPAVIQYYFQQWQQSFKSKTKATPLTLKFGNQRCHDASLDLWRVPIIITLKVLKDSQFYNLLYRLQNQLPGKVVLKQFSIKRTAPLIPPITKQITHNVLLGKKALHFFEGKIEFDWIYSPSG